VSRSVRARLASLTVPVLVTSAHRPLERRLALRLLDEGGEVRAYGQGETSALRAAGAFVSSGSPDDEGRLDAACTDVHTVVHVGGGLLDRDPGRMVADIDVLLRAVESAGVRRLIALSLPGADPDADDEVRRAKGQVEARLAASSVPTVVIRTSVVATSALLGALATAGLGAEIGSAQIAPVLPDDLIEMIVAFDRARSRSTSGHLVVAADGPERLSLEEFLARRAAGGPGTGALVGRTLPPAWLEDQLVETMTGPWWSEDPIIIDGWSFAGMTPQPIADVRASGDTT
jgi:uncharacterized protein YbjT (DUF2867 family)